MIVFQPEDMVISVVRRFPKFHTSEYIRRRNTVATDNTNIQELLKKHTVVSRDHLTPEIALHLITKECPLWTARPEVHCPFLDPFWAFYWPGGQALTRYILDNPTLFLDKTVVDVGCGCGATGIAAAMIGASRVVANDIDAYALQAVELNAALNKVKVETSGENLIGQINSRWDILLLGDMFYDEQFTDSLVDWTTSLQRKYDTGVFIGDPGRLPLLNHPIREKLCKVAQYGLTETSREENNGLLTSYVWKLSAG